MRSTAILVVALCSLALAAAPAFAQRAPAEGMWAVGGSWWDIVGRNFTGTVTPLRLDGNLVYNSGGLDVNAASLGVFLATRHVGVFRTS